jgi:hypothetical protein
VTVNRNDYRAVPTDEALAQVDSIAVLTAVGRDAPSLPASSATAATDSASVTFDPNSRPVLVMRKVRFATTRVIKGDVPACLELDIPGGRVGQQYDTNENFPRVITVGSRYVAFFVRYDLAAQPSPLRTFDIEPVDANGYFSVPFGGATNADTWTLDEEASVKPAPPSTVPNPPSTK